MSKLLVGGIIGCKDKTSPWHLNRFPDGLVTLGQQYDVGEKPTVILYTYINRHEETQTQKNKYIVRTTTKTNQKLSYST